MFKPIHQHMLYKIIVNNPVMSPELAKIFLYSMVSDLGMHHVTSPQAVYVPDAGNEGLTGSINLSTSHVAFHVWDNTNVMMLDVYSCKDFDKEVPIALVSDFFGIQEIVYSIEIDRETGILKGAE